MIPALAKRGRQPEERLERNLGPAHLLGEIGGATKRLGRLVEVALPPAKHAPHHVGEAELAREALTLGQRAGCLGLPLDALPVPAVGGQLRERSVQLDL